MTAHTEGQGGVGTGHVGQGGAAERSDGPVILLQADNWDGLNTPVGPWRVVELWPTGGAVLVASVPTFGQAYDIYKRLGGRDIDDEERFAADEAAGTIACQPGCRCEGGSS